MFHRTQFDSLLLTGTHDRTGLVACNHGRSVFSTAAGSVLTALSYAGDSPRLLVYRDHAMVGDHALEGQPSAACVTGGTDHAALWLSVCGRVCRAEGLAATPTPWRDLHGELLDIHAGDDAATPIWLLLSRGGELVLIRADGAAMTELSLTGSSGGQASLDVDAGGVAHVVFVRDHALHYRTVRANAGGLAIVDEATPAGAYASHPAVLAHNGEVLITYLGESWPVPESDCACWQSNPWQRRMGVGGYVALLALREGTWRRRSVAVSAQFAKPLWPKHPAFRYDYPGTNVAPRVDEFSAPAITLGPDGVPQIIFANTARRWVYASRYLADCCTDPAEIRGPFEPLSAPALVPRRATTNHSDNAIPIAIPTGARVYLDRIALAPRRVVAGRRIDFMQLDDLAQASGIDASVEHMRKHAANPVIRVGGQGSHDSGGAALAQVWREDGKWRCWCVSREPARKWRVEETMTSNDGIQWHRTRHHPLGDVFFVDGKPRPWQLESQFTWIRDGDEPDPASRFKGLVAADPPWGGKAAVVSADGVNWHTVRDAPLLISDGFSHIWRDAHDVPARRFKVTAAGRSVCGRVCVMWTSPDAIHWSPQRETLDFHDPFGSEPYWAEDYQNPQRAEVYASGRILVDPWAGPDDEDEIHHGHVFRDGDRWIVMYQKWTPRGHVFPALAVSRDGLNYSRVAGGASNLPLGGPGEWDSGRLVPEGAPIAHEGKWRQYYTGCAWFHGMGGVNPKPAAGKPEVVMFAPLQGGFAEIPQGRWVALRLHRDANEACLLTVPLSLDAPHTLMVDAAGLTDRGSEISLAIRDAATGDSITGFDFGGCDPIGPSTGNAPVTWQGRQLSGLGARSIRIAVRLRGHAVKLFGLSFCPQIQF